MSEEPVPHHVLIIGAGVFGLSTALSLLRHPEYQASRVTIVDGSPTLPNPSGSSVDASRIVRADYAQRHYARLAAQAQEHWRDRREGGWGGGQRYHEPGLVLISDEDRNGYVRESLANVRRLAEENGRDGDGGDQGRSSFGKIQELHGVDAVRGATGYENAGVRQGYANFNSGWADAEASVAYALRRVQDEGGERVTIRSGAPVERLLISMDQKCLGVELGGGELIEADLTVLAAGAWSASLIDLQGRCLATGQAMAYVDITDEEQAALRDRPTVLDMDSGMFIIPPRGKELKIARHGFGYRNPVSIPSQRLGASSSHGGDGDTAQRPVEVSLPKVGVSIPLEAEQALRAALAGFLPHLADRPFSRTRICWYCDTPTGDFLITYHPHHKNLFVATGGSGHGFKFLPVIGDKIVAAIQGALEPELARMWRWRTDEDVTAVLGGADFIACEDGSRAGRKGMILDEEMKRTG